MLKTKITLMISVVFLFIFALSSLATAQTGKMGYIDSDKIFAEYEDWTRAQEEFNTEYKAWEDEAKNMQTDLEDMIQEYEKQKLILSVEKKAEREAQIKAKQSALDAYTREIFGPNGTAERKNNTLVKPLLEKINAAIEKVSTDENYDFVFNSAGLAYAKKGYDITDKVLKALTEE
ncbi:MAG: OmpH family outer membrane protein [Candidatus Zixiibacteriota bacterium]